MTTQLANALPLLNARGLRATFFVNTDSWQYKQHQHEWEVDVLKAGHDLGNHTAHHSGAKTVEELTKEIGDCSDALAKVYGPKPRLVSFATPGGVPWNFTQDQLDPIFKKYHLVRADNRNFFNDAKTDPITFVQKALDNHWASNVSMHGTGGEWLSTSIPHLTKLLDFLVANRSRVWVAPEIEIYKYSQERDAANPPILKANGDRSFNIEVTCQQSKLAFSDKPITALYNQPLTVEVTVPDSWQSFHVLHRNSSSPYTTQSQNGVRVARFDILPNAGSVTVVQGT
jgi:hypothetical protein